ncbi:MAG: glutathione peroxidase [Porphyromonadaceae bacterium]|nr:MAG: glutathione peroxidase [Porphyromonadaceae bacterium]
MKKLIAIIFSSVLILQVFPQDTGTTSIYNIQVKSIDGKDFSLKQLQGKKVMIVNTASKCGFTPQYEQLESLYNEYGGDKFVIIGFPANNFLSQEPGSNAEIKEFCDSKYGVTFPMMAKISVKGDDMHPLYKWLTDKKLNKVVDSEVKWNFQKYLIDEKGNLVSVIPPKESPTSDQVIKWLKN